MCLIFLSFRNHPVYDLIIAGNRDEFYDRKTAVANYWPDQPNILAGRDLEACGTWMGVNTSGKVSMLTNYRDPRNIDPQAPSRGQLVSDFLTNDQSPENYLHELQGNGKRYNGFNLIVGDMHELWYYSNYREGISNLSPGFYGISNHLLETPWPKVVRGKQKMETALKSAVIDPEDLFTILYDDERAPDNELPDTGLPLEREKALSSMFIKTHNYGSRCSTVILIDKSKQVLFAERAYDLRTFEHTTQTYRFTL